MTSQETSTSERLHHMHSGTHQILEVILKSKDPVKNTIFTIKSLATSKDYTYKVRTNVYKDKKYLHISVECGYLEFKYLGFYYQGQIYRKGGTIIDSPAAKAISWCFKQIETDHILKLNENVQVMHTGKCTRCNRTLTDATSIQIGVGPKCRNY